MATFETYTAQEAHAAVDRGAAWLDERCPDWFTKLNLERLNLQDADQCVLGQTVKCLVPKARYYSGGYWRVIDHFELDSESDGVRLGFNAPPAADEHWAAAAKEENARYEMLTVAWREYVRQRLEANTAGGAVMSDNAIDISGLDPADVLAALYNASRPQGMGFLQYDPANMTREEAAVLLKEHTRFDYLNGRVMKVSITNPLDPWLYDRDNGSGAAARVIQELRKQHEAVVR